MWPTCCFGAGIAWAWLDSAHDLDLVIGHLHALDQRAAQRSLPAPIRRCQPCWDLCRTVLQAPHHQAHVRVQGVRLGPRWALRFHLGEPLAEPGDPGLERRLFKPRLGVEGLSGGTRRGSSAASRRG
jgi:hypothetical protein